MAGIGFELRKMIDQRDGFVAKVRAYACAGLISSGPWLMTIFTLTLLNLAGPYLGGSEGYSLFRTLVTYAFAFSLVLQGLVQMAVTRRVADLLYGKEYQRVLPAFVASLTAVGLGHAVIGTVFCLLAGFEPVLAFLAVTLFTILGMTWIALIWLSVVRQYDDVLRAYIYGTLVAMIGVLVLFLEPGTTGILAAYTAGQAATLILLLKTIVRGMESEGGRELDVLKSVVRFPLLVGVGFLYNAAIWIDKVIFWIWDGVAYHPFVRSHPLYDTCSFLAYLTVVPALALNLVRLETSFYEKYRAYYGAILAGTPLSVIEDKRNRMFGSLKESIVRLLSIQGAISVAVIVFAPVIIDVLELPETAIRVFRLTCAGAFFHVLLLINILMQMYYDLRKQALATSLVFLALNGALAYWSVHRGFETYGVGYAMASFLSLVFGFTLLNRALEKLDYHTFTSQPIGSKEERREAEALAAKEKEEEEAAEAQEKAEAEAEAEAPPFEEVEIPTAAAEAEAKQEQEEEEDREEGEEPAGKPVQPSPEVVEQTAAELEAALEEMEATATDFFKSGVEMLREAVATATGVPVAEPEPGPEPMPAAGEFAPPLPDEPPTATDADLEPASVPAAERTATDLGVPEEAPEPESARPEPEPTPQRVREPETKTEAELESDGDLLVDPKRLPPAEADDDTVAE